MCVSIFLYVSTVLFGQRPYTSVIQLSNTDFSSNDALFSFKTQVTDVGAFLETSSLALPYLLLLLAACPPLLHADPVSVPGVYIHLDILVADDISHNVVAHSGDEEILRGILLLRELLESRIDLLQ